MTDSNHMLEHHIFEDVFSFLRQVIRRENTDLICRTSPNALSEMNGRSSLTQCEKTGKSGPCKRRTGMLTEAFVSVQQSPLHISSP